MHQKLILYSFLILVNNPKQYVLVCHPYVTHMYSCHLYVTRMYSYVTRVMSLVCTHMSLVCTRVPSVCHSCVVLPWTLCKWKSFMQVFFRKLFFVTLMSFNSKGHYPITKMFWTDQPKLVKEKKMFTICKIMTVNINIIIFYH